MNALEELKVKLDHIYENDYELVNHVLSLVGEHEEDVKELLTFINKDSDVSRISVVTCAGEINNWRMDRIIETIKGGIENE
ncbi:hypothetical protein NXH64_01120 [Butyrivibrio fibrisolvens]|uniref:hypothetical protein n=1 Tax=Pseudobutyrivibrio ruminis TaxID=46206 RepID=UPI000413ACC2|nr:hypothetical protein [Pseudobutyrivibrio ruminis]MDC7278092.1 hypothetical protein [Butyrivibrio fibrisolvens]